MAEKKKFLLPLLVLFVSIIGAIVIVASKPEVKPAPPEVTRKVIRAQEVRKQSVQMTVRSQGTVVPRTESALVSQVAGLIMSVSASFVAGGFFEKGDVLVSLDPRDYEFALTQAKLQVAQAELTLTIEEQEAEVAREEWRRLNEGDAPALAAREPQLQQARAALDAAKAGMEQAQLTLERTQIRAPFAGRVRMKNVDVGQYVTPGMAVATIYAVDYVEVRLPIPDDELAYVDIPVDFRTSQSNHKGPDVVLRARFAGQEHQWLGYLTRIEGEIDARSRMIHAVARVESPYDRKANSNRPPLTVGMFVHAEITGKAVDGLFAIPRAALRDNNQVLIVDDEERLRFRSVDLFRLDAEIVYINSGLIDGELICISPLQAVVDGMPVSVFEGGSFMKEETEGSVKNFMKKLDSK
jgi:RND family efflux transporter MFP subunit